MKIKITILGIVCLLLLIPFLVIGDLNTDVDSNAALDTTFGGTNLTSVITGLMYGTGSAYQAVTNGTSSQFLMGGTPPAFQTFSSLDITGTAQYQVLMSGANPYYYTNTAAATALTNMETARGDSDWQTWAATLGGITSATQNNSYKVVDDIVYMVVNITGTYDSGSFTFSLPETIENTTGFAISDPIIWKNNGSWQTSFGRISCAKGGTSCTVYQDAGTTETWTGAIGFLGKFFYKLED